MAYVNLNSLSKTAEKQLDSCAYLPNGIEFYTTVFGPGADSKYVCSVAICYPSCSAAEPQRDCLGKFETVKAAVDAANSIATDASNEAPATIFGLIA